MYIPITSVLLSSLSSTFPSFAPSASGGVGLPLSSPFPSAPGAAACSNNNTNIQRSFNILAGNKDAQSFCESKYGTATRWAGSGSTAAVSVPTPVASEGSGYGAITEKDNNNEYGIVKKENSVYARTESDKKDQVKDALSRLANCRPTDAQDFCACNFPASTTTTIVSQGLPTSIAAASTWKFSGSASRSRSATQGVASSEYRTNGPATRTSAVFPSSGGPSATWGSAVFPSSGGPSATWGSAVFPSGGGPSATWGSSGFTTGVSATEAPTFSAFSSSASSVFFSDSSSSSVFFSSASSAFTASFGGLSTSSITYLPTTFPTTIISTGLFGLPSTLSSVTSTKVTSAWATASSAAWSEGASASVPTSSAAWSEGASASVPMSSAASVPMSSAAWSQGTSASVPTSSAAWSQGISASVPTSAAWSEGTGASATTSSAAWSQGTGVPSESASDYTTYHSASGSSAVPTYGAYSAVSTGW